jgi:hypothetical protein
MTKLEKVVRSSGVRAKWVSGATGPIPEGMRDMHPYTVTLTRGGKKITTPFYTGVSVRLEERASQSKIAADVLHSLVSDTQGFENARDFEDWASEYGYDVDSRKAERIYQSLSKIAPQVRDFLGEDFETFAEAAQDY